MANVAEIKPKEPPVYLNHEMAVTSYGKWYAITSVVYPNGKSRDVATSFDRGLPDAEAVLEAYIKNAAALAKEFKNA